MDYFDRQKRIANWDQNFLTQSVAVCFGVGGLGSIVSLNLCRMGVGRIILIDYDRVEYHNLNRQLLLSKEDIGKLKVEAAKESLEKTHNLVSHIEAYNLDIIAKWDQVINIVKEATVVFNMIDYGDYFDLAAQSLCRKLKCPLIQGGTFSQCVNVEFFPPESQSCLACGNDSNNDILNQIIPSKIMGLENLTFLPKNNNPVGLSNSYLCGVCGMMMTAKFGEWALNRNQEEKVCITNRSIFYVNTMEAVNFSVERKPGCLICQSEEN